MLHPRFIILTATYRQPKRIVEAAASVLAQTCRDWQWHVVLDGPTAEVDEVVKRPPFTDRRIVLHRCATTEEQRRATYRPAAIFNDHMDDLTRRHPDALLSWLSDDDLLKPKYLQELGKALAEGKGQVACCGYHVTEEVCGQFLTRTVVSGAMPFGGDSGNDPLGYLDATSIMQTADSFRALGPHPIPTGWDTAAVCDGIYLRRLAERHAFRNVDQVLFVKRMTRSSTHYRPARIDA